jgi:hypothetical protein
MHFKVKMPFADLRRGLSVVEKDLKLHNDGETVDCCKDMFYACVDLSRFPETEPSERLRANDLNQIMSTSAVDHDVQPDLLASVISVQWSPYDFQEVTNFVNRGKATDSIHVLSPRKTLIQLARKKNFSIHVGRRSIECNRVIAASACDAIALAMEEDPSLPSYEIEVELSDTVIDVLTRFLMTEEIDITEHNYVALSEIASELIIQRLKTAVDQFAQQHQRYNEALLQLTQVIEFQKDSDSINEETFGCLVQRSRRYFAVDRELWRLIVYHSYWINSVGHTLCQRLINECNSNGNGSQQLEAVVDQSSFLTIIQADDVEAFGAHWRSHSVLDRAIPGRNLFVCITNNWQDLPIRWDNQQVALISVVAFYGAVKCLRLLIANHVPLQDQVNPNLHPLVFAIAGGNVEAIKLLNDVNVSFVCRIVFAIAYHQNDVFDWIMAHSDKQDSECVIMMNRILPISVRMSYFHGIQYCLKQGLHKNLIEAMRQAIACKKLARFRVLLLFPESSMLSLEQLIPLAIRTRNKTMVKLVMSLSSNLSLSVSAREECLSLAIRIKSIEIIDLIWDSCRIDELLLNPITTTIGNDVIATEDKAIIQRFLPYGNIFSGQNDLLSWLTRLTKLGKRDVIDMITNGATDYFKGVARTVLLECTDIETAQYLLEHGADPNYRGEDGLSACHMAVIRKDLPMQALLSEFGGQISARELAKLKR